VRPSPYRLVWRGRAQDLLTASTSYPVDGSATEGRRRARSCSSSCWPRSATRVLGRAVRGRSSSFGGLALFFLFFFSFMLVEHASGPRVRWSSATRCRESGGLASRLQSSCAAFRSPIAPTWRARHRRLRRAWRRPSRPAVTVALALLADRGPLWTSRSASIAVPPTSSRCVRSLPARSLAPRVGHREIRTCEGLVDVSWCST